MDLQPGQTVGIDLGTTYSSLAQMGDAGTPETFRNADGQLSTPSVIMLGEKSIIVGPSFSRLSVEPPENVIEAIKREMGRDDFARMYHNQKLTPEVISAMILRKLKQDAESQIGPIGNAVISVPYYFNDRCRKATQDAGRLAGLNVIDLINEPTAATLAYAWQRGELGRPESKAPERTILVYDLGGGTFDVTIVRFDPIHFTVVATDGDVRLGGLDWTKRIVDFMADLFQRQHGKDPRESQHARMQLTQRCELAKRRLSEQPAVGISFTWHGLSVSTTLAREQFEDATADLLQRTIDTTELVLEDAEVAPRELDDLLVVGGSSHMPAVARALYKLLGRTATPMIDRELAVAHGAAIHAAILEARALGEKSRMSQALSNRLRSVQTRDVCAHNLGVELTDRGDESRKRQHVMIPRNTQIPHTATGRFVTTVADPEGIRLRLLEGEAEESDACVLIGDLRITGLPPELPAGSPVEVTYKYDASGRIHVSAREMTSRSKSTILIERLSGGLTEGAVDSLRRIVAGYRIE